MKHKDESVFLRPTLYQYHIMNPKKVWKSLVVFSFLMGSLCTVSYGQFAEGSKAVGGNVGFYSQTVNPPSGLDFSQNSFQLQLNGGYFFKENLEAGLRLGLSTTGSELESQQGAQRTSGSSFNIGPYGRAYYTITDVLSLFGEGGMNFGFGGDSDNNRLRTFDMGVSPGIVLMVNENLGLEAKTGFFGYVRQAIGESENFNDTKEISSVFQAGLNLNTVSFGFRLYITD
jgi:hypothetical protein